MTNPVSTEYMDFAMNWLAQHIKNTDFKYKYKLATHHDVPEPYVWNTEFAVNYGQMDSEHRVLFELLLAVETDPTNQEKVDILQEKMREHFYNEEEKFCDAIDLPWDYCKEHKKKHVLFSGKFSKMKAPVDVSEVKWAQGELLHCVSLPWFK